MTDEPTATGRRRRRPAGKLTRLKGLRERAALTQRELAELAGINRLTIAKLETLEDQPRPATVRKIAVALGVRPAELYEPLP